jgi:ABC-type phosphate/phosphonate transport system substrate-binding protein
MKNRASRLMVVAMVALAVVGLVAGGALGQQLGTKDKPIQMLFPPSQNGDVIKATANAIVDYLFKETGLYVKPVPAPDYPTLVSAFVSAQGDVFGIPTSAQYLEIYKQTNGGVIPTVCAVRSGYTYYYTSFYTLRSKGYKSIQDLTGKIWIYNDEGSGSGYKFPKIALDAAGVVPASVVRVGSAGHPGSMIALLQGQGDFCTSYGSPPLAPKCLMDQGIKWQWGDDPELMVWDYFNNTLVRDGLRWECLDLRYSLLDKYPDIFSQVGVVAVAGPIPNDVMAFVSNFPSDLRDKIVAALEKEIQTPEGLALWNNAKFYQWSGMEPVTDQFFDVMRQATGYEVPKR